MNKVPRSLSLLLVTALVPMAILLQPACLKAQTGKNSTGDAQFVRRPLPQVNEKDRMNAWTVGLAGGLLEGAPIRLAAEMARVVDDGADLHLLPIVTRGATDNLNALLYLRGVDTAIINSDALDEYKLQVPQIQSRITYLLNLFPV
ncbi:hypothetical protein ACVW1A_003285 [Bradyrhizobium sp. LB1.3]